VSGRRDRHQPAFSLCCKGESGLDVVPLEIREVRQDLVLAHPGGEVVQNVGDSDLQATDTPSCFSVSSENSSNDTLLSDLEQCAPAAEFTSQSH
jgi:hypothetical protein